MFSITREKTLAVLRARVIGFDIIFDHTLFTEINPPKNTVSPSQLAGKRFYYFPAYVCALFFILLLLLLYTYTYVMYSPWSDDDGKFYRKRICGEPSDFAAFL